MCKITDVQVNGQNLQVGREYDLYIRPDLKPAETVFVRKQTFRGVDCNGTFEHLMFTNGTVPRHGLSDFTEWSEARDAYWKDFALRARNGQVGSGMAYRA